ncbi:hypothetical protein DFO46_1437 [Rhizobium sp. AG855]|nr:hypothetical protein DFO46_1437 [Rhizobium sp. AG855]
MGTHPTEPPSCEISSFGPDRANSSQSLRAASRSGLRSLKSIHWIDFWPSATARRSPPQGGRWSPRLACVWILGSSPRMTTSRGDRGILRRRYPQTYPVKTVAEDTSRSPTLRHPRARPEDPDTSLLRPDGHARQPHFPKKGDEFRTFPNKIKPRHIFSSPTLFPFVESSLSRPRIHLTMRCQARRGRRRGGGLSQIQIPGPLQRSPSGRRA